MLAGLIVTAAAAWQSCQHVPATAAPEGHSSYRFVEPPPPPAPDQKAAATSDPNAPVQTLLMAVPIQPLASPEYPAAARGTQRIPARVGVRITVDANGRVASVQPSLFVLSTPTSQADAFRTAVEDAVAQWRFRPAELRTLRAGIGANGEPIWALLRREKTECTFDVEFMFSASGDVTANLPNK